MLAALFNSDESVYSHLSAKFLSYLRILDICFRIFFYFIVEYGEGVAKGAKGEERGLKLGTLTERDRYGYYYFYSFYCYWY